MKTSQKLKEKFRTTFITLIVSAFGFVALFSAVLLTVAGLVGSATKRRE